MSGTTPTGLKREVLEGEALSDREVEVLHHTARGLTAVRTGEAMFLAAETIKTYRKNAMYKLYANNISHAVALAIGLGLINIADLVDEWEERNPHGYPQGR